MKRKDKIILEFNKSEALVLFDFLSRIDEKYDENSGLFEHLAEMRVFWDIVCMLEKILVEPFSPDYIDIVEKARYEVAKYDLEYNWMPPDHPFNQYKKPEDIS